MKVAVIGAGGFLGGALTTAFARQGIPVHALGRDWRGVPVDDTEDRVTRFEGDAGDPEVTRAAMRGCTVAYFLAYQGVPLMDGADHLEEYDNNLRMLVSAISGAEYGGVERLVLLSSGGTVYGETDGPATEDVELRPISHYGAIKKLSEEMLAHYVAVAGTLSYAVARVANPFGPGQVNAKRKGLVVSAMLKALAQEPVLVHNDGTQVRDYVFVDDVVRALMALGTSSDAANEVFNVGSGAGRSVEDVLADIERVSGLALDRRHVRGRLQDVDSNVLSVEKLAKVLGDPEATGYEDGLRLTWQAVSRAAGPARDLP
ncbi:NAD-dependent epimerase/dehydratase family protein [Nocardioides immobilis]|uniref:NAD-dependent epimerase/dehydratase family protein n=1 Tax=Nocardioides immobilis TaxID=2049295 RepID=A0A417Y5Q0_9ACTN|nr:NAD-dependent epimerase/dehydratase family protein [Nocardioides immobilis]RHW27871.1 NAD-dependent epimerase/dehydratase family protein [Nocardioides immobilis]